MAGKVIHTPTTCDCPDGPCDMRTREKQFVPPWLRNLPARNINGTTNNQPLIAVKVHQAKP